MLFQPPKPPSKPSKPVKRSSTRKAAPKAAKPPLNVPQGTFKARFFAYHWNGARLSAGDSVQLTYHPGKRRLESDFTGGTVDADGVFSYCGQIVGCVFSEYYLERLKPLAKAHSVKVQAVCLAWNPAGYPEMELRSDFRAA